MKRKTIDSLLWAFLIVGMVSSSPVFGSPPAVPATLKAVTVSRAASGNELRLRIEGEYSFKAFQPSLDTLYFDLKGVRIGALARTGHWTGDVLTGYRLLSYTDAAGKPAVRVQVEMKRSESFTVQGERVGLRVLFRGNQGDSVSAALPEATGHTGSTPRSAGGVTRTLSNGLAEVSDIAIKAGERGETFVDVPTTRSIPYRVLRLANPARLVVDFEGARQLSHQRIYAAHSSVLKEVRVGQFRTKDPAVTRVVVDLDGDPIFDVHGQAGGVRIELKSRTQPGSSVPSPKENAPAAVQAVKVKGNPLAAASVAPISGSQAQSASAQVAKPILDPVASRTAPTLPASASPTNYQNALPAGTRANDVAALRPQPPQSTPQVLRAAKAAQTLRGDLRGTADALQGQAPAGPAAGAAEEKPKYTGEPVSLNLKDVDLKDFFRLIHELSGLNIIVDPNVSGSVTMVLEAVPWDQALDIVLKNNRLAKTLEGNVLRIARMETLAAEQEETAKLAAAREEAAPLVTRFIPVNYAKAGTLATMLKSWTGGGALTKRGNILVDERTNTLIVADIQPQIPIIESIVKKLDTKSKQVQIEARIVQATADFSRNLQAILTGAAVNPSGTVIGVGQMGNGASATPTHVIGGTPNITVTDTAVSGFGAVAVVNATKNYVLNAALAAAELRDQAKLISRPTIVTQNNVPGTIKQGTQIPIQTSINLTVTTTYVDATLTLTVTPQVTEDGNVFLNIVVNNASVGVVLPFTTNPQINTQQATTSVLVPDGGTVVFGGVTATTRSRSVNQFPLLGSIPVLGHLFKSTVVKDSDTELLFFVSPKVLPG